MTGKSAYTKHSMFKGAQQQSTTSVIAPKDLLHTTAVYLPQTALVSQTVTLSAESHAYSVRNLFSNSSNSQQHAFALFLHCRCVL